MAKIGLIAWKELKTYFTSWIAYVLITGWLFIAGLLFLLVLQRPQEFQVSPIYNILVTIMLFIAPLVTMRLVAEERSSGSLEMLFTSPLTEWQVTLGKFFGAWAFIGILLLVTLHLPFFATHYGSIDTGPVWGSYIALLCVGAAFMSFGLFCSSLTESQVVAGFLTFGGLMISWMLNWPAQEMPTSDVAGFIGHWSVFSHFQDMMRGAVDTKDLIFFLSFTVLFLFATVRVLESRKWR
ncbi:MAG: ABC transporter permease [Abitibacteriaceae bacterium]|nr:ABC transporter permease [Abditibacteriaceae bacterium]